MNERLDLGAGAPDFLHQDFWARPDYDPAANSVVDATTFAAAVGLAVAKWAEIEDRLTELFASFMTNGNRGCRTTADLVFVSVESLPCRLDIILAAAEGYFGRHWCSGEIRTPLITILNAVSFAFRRRNDLVRGRITEQYYNDVYLGVFLSSSPYTHSGLNKARSPENLGAGEIRGRYKYGNNEINRLSDGFDSLSNSLCDYIFDVIKVDDLPNTVKRMLDRQRYAR